MSVNSVLITQENSGGDFAIKTVTAESGKALGFDSEFNPVMLSVGGVETFYTQTADNFAFDANNGRLQQITGTTYGSYSITLANMIIGKEYIIIVANNHIAGTLTLVFPTTNTRTETISVGIPAQTNRIISVIYTGTITYWMYSRNI